MVTKGIDFKDFVHNIILWESSKTSTEAEVAIEKVKTITYIFFCYRDRR